MKDSVLLLLTAALCAALAWAFWHYLGNAAFSITSGITVVVLTADNARLRRRLRERELGK